MLHQVHIRICVKDFFVILLRSQIETETGSAGEQPDRDKFDQQRNMLNCKDCLWTVLF
jgi:hypothetical protein